MFIYENCVHNKSIIISGYFEIIRILFIYIYLNYITRICSIHIKYNYKDNNKN